MILTVDIGNTNIVLGGFREDKLEFVSRLKTDKYKMQDEYAIAFKAVLEFNGYTKDMLDGAIISCVVPPLIPIIKRAIAKLLDCKVLVVSPGTKTGLHIKIDDPGVLGADLVCSAVGAISRYTMPCIIVDLGTATKFSIIDKDGGFLGGAIMPGVNISLDALSKRTAQLPHIEIEDTTDVIGTNSIDCMKSGVVFGTASMIDGMIEKISEKLNQQPTVIVTGGVANNIVNHCKTEMIYEENLISYGLLDIYNKNVKA